MRECKTGAVHEMRMGHECCKLADKWFMFDKDGKPEACPDCGNLIVALTFKAKFDDPPYADQWACPRCLNRENIKLKQVISQMHDTLKNLFLRNEASMPVGELAKEWVAAIQAMWTAQGVVDLEKNSQ